MPEIQFECPSCKQKLTVPEELRAQLIDCPGCAQTIEVPVHGRSMPPATQEPKLASSSHTGSKASSPKLPGTVALVVVFCIYLLVLVLLFRQWRVDELTHALSLDLSGRAEPSFGPTIFWLIIWGFVGGTVGFLTGRARGKERHGAAWGLALGPVGWLITLCSSDLRRRCAECSGVIPDGARRCMHCGVTQFAVPDSPLDRNEG